MSYITTHVLDTSIGTPAAGVDVTLFHMHDSGEPETMATGRTNDDGRIADLLTDDSPAPGIYRLSFETASYFSARGVESFYPRVDVTFEIREAAGHYHVPLLISPFAYSTYRGS